MTRHGSELERLRQAFKELRAAANRVGGLNRNDEPDRASHPSPVYGTPTFTQPPQPMSGAGASGENGGGNVTPGSSSTEQELQLIRETLTALVDKAGEIIDRFEKLIKQISPFNIRAILVALIIGLVLVALTEDGQQGVRQAYSEIKGLLGPGAEKTEPGNPKGEAAASDEDVPKEASGTPENARELPRRAGRSPDIIETESAKPLPADDFGDQGLAVRRGRERSLGVLEKEGDAAAERSPYLSSPRYQPRPQIAPRQSNPDRHKPLDVDGNIVARENAGSAPPPRNPSAAPSSWSLGASESIEPGNKASGAEKTDLERLIEKIEIEKPSFKDPIGER